MEKRMGHEKEVSVKVHEEEMWMEPEEKPVEKLFVKTRDLALESNAWQVMRCLSETSRDLDFMSTSLKILDSGVRGQDPLRPMYCCMLHVRRGMWPKILSQ